MRSRSTVITVCDTQAQSARLLSGFKNEPLETSRAFFRTLHRRLKMLWTIFVILLVLWLLGLVSSYTLGGYIHILLVIAIVVLVVNLLTGRRGAI